MVRRQARADEVIEWVSERPGPTIQAVTEGYADGVTPGAGPQQRRFMIPKDCKRLAEVDFPIAEVSRHAPREKYIRETPNTALHTWWAQRPLAACRAVLLGLLWPDPCDPICPREFKVEARELLRTVPGCNPGATDEGLRRALLKFIGDFANSDIAANRTYLDVSRALVKAAILKVMLEDVSRDTARSSARNCAGPGRRSSDGARV
jgi:hypothetical protein